MERVLDLLRILMNYILKNNLNIDKSTFFTVIIGQITIYGILLTFYQFVASYQGNEKKAIRYLGINITEYFVKKKISVFNNIVSKKIFGLIVVLEIMYKPFIAIYGEKLSAETISVMNFIWYLFVIFFFVLFVILFFQCTKSILLIKLCSDAKTNGYLIDEINKMFLKKTMKERITQKTIDLFRKDFGYLRDAIRFDDNIELQGKYNDLIYMIFADYMNRKKHEISLIENKGKVVRNQEPWIYNANCEVHLLQEIIRGNYFQLDEKNVSLILKFHISLLKLNLVRAKLAGYSKISFNRYESFYIQEKEKIFDVSEWKNVTLKIYQKLSDEKKKELIFFLQGEMNQKQDMYGYYCDHCIKDLLRMEIDSIFEGEREQKDFIKIFDQIIKNEHINDFCSQIIRDKIVYYNRFDIEELIGQLSERNCIYIFSYIMMYYSIYRFRFEWKYININVLKALWKQQDYVQYDAGEVISRIKNSNIGHRFEEQMYLKFMEYIAAGVDGKVFNRVYDENILDGFYFWAIKVSVINKDDLMYSIYQNDLDIDIQIAIINELSKHEELLENKNIFNWVQHMRYNTFSKQNSLPENLNVTLRSLLLADINVVVVANYACAKCYIYVDVIGAYLLIKLHELPDKIQKQKQVKKIIKGAFIASNINVDEYINMLEKECRICRCENNYVQKEKMKGYLLKLF